MVVHAAHKGVRAAKLFTDWGIKLADKSGLDAIVVSVPFALPVYEKCGFMCVKDVEIDFSTPNASEKWKAWQAEDMRAFLMVRPGKQMPNLADSAA
jgi:hypothetical protein